MVHVHIMIIDIGAELDIGGLGFGFGILGGSKGISVLALSNGKTAIKDKRQGGTTLGSFQI